MTQTREERAAKRHTWYVVNRTECIARTLQWRKDNPDGRRKHRRTARGVVNATGETKVAPCEICLCIMKLQQDHNHETGQRRGWICGRCNIALGWLELIRANGLQGVFDSYLQKYEGF